jgi:hypothetical protein
MTMKALLGQTPNHDVSFIRDEAALVSFPIDMSMDNITHSAHHPLSISTLRMSTTNLLTSSIATPMTFSKSKPPLPNSSQKMSTSMIMPPTPHFEPARSINNRQILNAQAAMAVYHQHYQGLQVSFPEVSFNNNQQLHLLLYSLLDQVV